MSIDPSPHDTSVQNDSLVYEQAIVVHIVLLDELCKLVSFLGVIKRIDVQDLVARP